MAYSPITIKRRRVLGDLYEFCEPIKKIPVQMDNKKGEKLGYVEETLGTYIDAYVFHLPEDVCKKLSTGHYHYSFDFDLTRPKNNGGDRRVTLNRIFLTGRQILKEVKGVAPKKTRTVRKNGYVSS